ncbi:exo-alpha-sialidase, partial [Trypanosoma cruzi]
RPLPAVMAHFVRKLRDSPPHNKHAHRQQSSTMEDEKRHSATASSSIPRATGYDHSPQPTHNAHEVITQAATCGSGSSPSHDAATTFPVIPSTMGLGAQLKGVIGGASRQQQS